MPLLHHAGTLLSLALVFWTGSSLFAVLHPRIVMTLAQGGRHRGETEEAMNDPGRIRLQGGLMSLAGLVLLALPMIL